MAFLEPISARRTAAGQTRSCTVRARVKISAGALLQVGMDDWRSPTVRYGSGGNNHEAGASDWYFSSPQLAGSFVLPISAARNCSELVEDGAPPAWLDGWTPVLHHTVLARMKPGHAAIHRAVRRCRRGCWTR